MTYMAAFVENYPDWIQFSNARALMLKYRFDDLYYLSPSPQANRPQINLSTLDDSDTVIIIGHGSSNSVGDYATHQSFVRALIDAGLQNKNITVWLQSCSAGEKTAHTVGRDGHQEAILSKIRGELTFKGLSNVKIKGATSATITGWRLPESVVKKSQSDSVGDIQGDLESTHQASINKAQCEIYLRIDHCPTSKCLVELATEVYGYTKDFFNDFARQVPASALKDQDKKQGSCSTKYRYAYTYDIDKGFITL
ncbi:MAG: hypothetical protein LBV79_09175 [Candidatus Adiutrix sp.]|jgi:hypothetical protein|nr:hypothetical protein [Candidatus Adiutrix sp.]